MEMLEDVVLTVRRLHQPVIAAVNGAAIGGGLCLALACDLRLAAPAAYFRAAGINNGLTASELGLSFLLPRAVGSTRAADIMLTGRDVLAEEAERIGLVSSVAPDVVAAAVEMGQRIAGFSQPGVELTKKSLHAGQSRHVAGDLPVLGGPRPALPPAAHRQLRGGDPRAQGGPPAGLQGRALSLIEGSVISTSAGKSAASHAGWTSPTTCQPRCR